MDSEYEQEEKKKIQITRGMLILAVIVLVAIVIVIAIIINAVNKKEKLTTSEFEKLEARMEDEAPIYITQKGIVLNDVKITVDLDELLEENGGSINKEKIKAAKICEGYVLAYKQESEVYEAYISCGDQYQTSGYISNEKEETTKKSDKKKPVISLKGSNPLNLVNGAQYNEPGASATDNIDGDITEKIKITGSVNSSVAGKYTITYEVTDKAGNTAKTIRTVIVGEKVTTTTTKAPVNVTTTRSVVTTTKKTTTARPTTPPSLYLNGDTTINLNVGEAYNEPGYSARDLYGKDITGQVAVSSNLNTNVAGTYYITYKVTDSYGNSSMKTRTIIVKNSNIAVLSVSITPNNFELQLGTRKTLVVLFSPSNATNKTITWSTSNSAVATVSGGVVYANAKGTAIITAKTSNGKTATAKVIVK